MAQNDPPRNALLAAVLAHGDLPRTTQPVSELAKLFAPPAADSSGFFNFLAATPATPDYSSLLSAISEAPAPSPLNALAILGNQPSLLANAPLPYSWYYVRQRFSQFATNLAPTAQQNSDAQTQQAGVVACLNRHYYGVSSSSANSQLIGSWGKDTRVRPPRDADLLFLLPPQVYHRYAARVGNRQSQLLQEVKLVLAASYPRTDVGADGQVVVVPFDPPIEVAPGFVCEDGSVIVCDANRDGRYTVSTATAEIADIGFWDICYGGNARALIRAAKQWQRYCDVPLKSFCIERVAIAFLHQWPYRERDVFWHDWMMRDFFAFLITKAGTSIAMPGTGETVDLGHDWLSKARTAYGRAVKACEYEHSNSEGLAGGEWQKIFGQAIPMWVT